MSIHYLASGSSTSVWPDNALILYDSASSQDITGSLQDTPAYPTMLGANVDTIYLQRMANDALQQGTPNADLIYLQRMANDALQQGTPNADLIYLQRMGKMCPDKTSTLVWLMRARNTANTRYIYWRSPRSPSTYQVDTSTIILSTVESVGSVYEEI